MPDDVPSKWTWLPLTARLADAFGCSCSYVWVCCVAVMCPVLVSPKTNVCEKENTRTQYQTSAASAFGAYPFPLGMRIESMASNHYVCLREVLYI
jgi:hypothetical protein